MKVSVSLVEFISDGEYLAVTVSLLKVEELCKKASALGCGGYEFCTRISMKLQVSESLLAGPLSSLTTEAEPTA